jgi:hypothetical protein
MKPRSKSEWISPAACGAFDPFATVHARASFGPTVKKVIKWRSSYPARMTRVSPVSCKPISSRNGDPLVHVHADQVGFDRRPRR